MAIEDVVLAQSHVLHLFLLCAAGRVDLLAYLFKQFREILVNTIYSPVACRRNSCTVQFMRLFTDVSSPLHGKRSKDDDPVMLADIAYRGYKGRSKCFTIQEFEQCIKH